MQENQAKTLLSWKRKIHKQEWAHRFESQTQLTINTSLGIITLILAAIMSTLPNIPNFDAELLKIIIPIGAAIIAIFSGLQTFLKPSEISEKCRIKSEQFESLRHQLQELIEFTAVTASDKEFEKNLSSFRMKWDNIGTMNVSNKNFNKAEYQIKKLDIYP